MNNNIEMEKEGLSKKALVGVVLTVIIVGLLSGGGAYYAGHVKSEDVKKDLQSQIDSMKAEVTAIKTGSVAVATPTPTPAVSASPTAVPTATATADWRNYSNAAYGFGLTLTDVWSKYSTFEKTPESGNILKYINFLLPSTDSSYASYEDFGKAGVVSPFCVGVYTIDGYAKEKEKADLEGGILYPISAQNNKYVFTIMRWQDVPSDLRDIDLGMELIKKSIAVRDVK